MMKIVVRVIVCCAAVACVAPSLGWAKTYSPTAVLELHIKPEDVHELREVLQGFATAEGLTFRDVGADMPSLDGKPLLYFTLHRGKALQAIVDESPSDGGVSIAFYDFASDPQSRATASKLQTRLSRRWQLTMIPLGVTAEVASDPDVILGLHVKPDELDDLRDIIQGFAQAEGFELRDEGIAMPNTATNRGVVALRLTRDTGVQVFVGDLQGSGQFHVAFYNSHADRDFGDVVSVLKNTLRQKWSVHELK